MENVTSVTINDTKSGMTLHTWKWKNNTYSQVRKSFKDKQKTVIEGNYKGKEWGVYILCGNCGYVDKPDNGVAKNASSLVTLVKHGADRFLFCGDANALTEDYILNASNLARGNFKLKNNTKKPVPLRN